MALKPWSELTVSERHNFSVQARRNPRKAYEKLVAEDSAAPTPKESVPSTDDDSVDG